MSTALAENISWERMIAAVEAVRRRVARATEVLNQAELPYAVAGGNAVAAWVSAVDRAAVRNTQDVGILLRRSDLEKAAQVLEQAGFVRRHVAGMDIFLDGPQAKVRDAVHVVFAGEKVRPNYASPAPDVAESVWAAEAGYRILTLEALVRMKLTSFRDKDRVHLRDLLEVGLIDTGWCGRLPPELARRLRQLLDNPEG